MSKVSLIAPSKLGGVMLHVAGL
uniref:Uncharacterized protein n=1 Tax=Anguilla anguilla TaxID=7936 RepID=A0A0E9P8S6_ANGAN